MKKFLTTILTLSSLTIFGSVFATSTGGTSRSVSINGEIDSQEDAPNGTNGASWEVDEELSAGSGVFWYLTWDNTNLYVGRKGGNNTEPQIIYIQAEYSGSSYTSTPITYDNFTPDFSGLSSPSGINFAAYLKSGYDEFRTWNGTAWTSSDNSLSPQYDGDGGDAEMEVTITWNQITASNGTPTNFRIIFYNTNGNGGSIFAYGQSPSGNPSGSVSTPTVSNWWGGFSVISGIAPNSSADNSLPVELSYFTARQQGNNVRLDWSTESEVNNAGFRIYRRKFENIKDYELIADFRTDKTLKGQGSTPFGNDYFFYDNQGLASNTNYEYIVADVDFNGKETKHKDKPATIFIVFSPIPKKFTLLGNFPNPFNPETTIEFSVPEQAKYSIEIYNVLGQSVKVLADNEIAKEGSNQISWDGTDENNSLAPSGVYFYKITSGNETQVRKMLLLK